VPSTRLALPQLLGCFEVALVAGRVQPRLEEAFRNADGIAWHDHEDGLSCSTARFFEPGYRANLVAGWLPALDGVTEKLRSGALVADVGCGLGVSTLLMADAYQATTFLGFDYHLPSIETAREAVQGAGLEGRAAFQQSTAKDFPGEGYDMVTMFDCLHDLGDPVGAARHVHRTLAEDGTWMIVEPQAGNRVEDNLNPVGRLYYGASALVCTPTSLSQEVGLALGAQAGEEAIRSVVEEAGFSSFRRAAETPFNIVFEARR